LQFLAEQIDSINDQTHPYERIFVGIDEMKLDNSARELLSKLTNMTIIFSANKGSIRNFENLLNIALENTDLDLIFFADQDDVWVSSKIEEHVSIFEQTEATNFCIFSDLSGIDSDGREIQSSLFQSESRLVLDFPFFNNVLRNSVSGCTLSIDRDLAKLALPFPKELQQLGVHHDAWINALIGAVGVSTYIEKPLVKYRQHASNQIGIMFKKFRYRGIRSKVISYRIRRRIVQLVIHRATSREIELRNANYKLFDSKPIYFFLSNWKRVLRNSNRALYLDFLVGALLSKVVVGLFSIRNQFQIFLAIFSKVKNLIVKLNSLRKSGRLRTALDKVWNSPFAQENNVVDRVDIESLCVLKSKKSIILLVPHLPPEPIFGGISTALELALALAKINGRKLILVSTNQKIENVLETQKLVNQMFLSDAQIEIKDSQTTLIFDKDDIFILTAWWTAEYLLHIENEIDFVLKKIYLIQDFEPNFYPWSSNYSRALLTYKIDARRVFNTSLLKDFFIDLGLANASDMSIKPTVSSSRLVQSVSKKPIINVVFYYRPSVARNMASLTIESLNYYISNRNSKIDVNFTSVGEYTAGLNIAGIPVNSFGHMPLKDYTTLLSKQDIGLSLMLSPHPSYPPLDMAASGVITISNTYCNKTPGSIPLVKLVEPDVRALGKALIAAESQFFERSRITVGKLNEIRDSLGEYSIFEAAQELSTWD
jgi:hypothetical protein